LFLQAGAITFEEILRYLNKNIKIFFNYFLGPLLFLWFCFAIYRQLQHQPDLPQKWASIKAAIAGPEKWILVLAGLLMPVNWGIEALKWQLSVTPVQHLPYWRAFKATFTGVTMAINTPNRMGEYIGRIFYMDEGKRLRAISLTIVGSISQLIVTMVTGSLAIFYIKLYVPEATYSNLGLSSFWLDILQYGVLAITVILVMLYFRLSWIVRGVEKLPGISKYVYLINVLEDFNIRILWKILTLSFIRFGVFVIQYLLLFHVFGVELAFWQGFWMVSLMFLVLAIVPTIALAELGLRNQTSILLVGMFSSNTVGIFFTTFGIWMINLFIPALLGSLLILRLKIFNNRNEHQKSDH
jgi:Lysylphosphatidylglycerol synthase TM region